MHYRILAFLWVIAMVAYVQQAAISVPLLEIGRDLALTDPIRELGLVQSAWYLCYALFQLPGGWLADRIGGRRGIMLFAVLASLATGLAGVSRGYWELLATWALMGALQAGLFSFAGLMVVDAVCWALLNLQGTLFNDEKQKIQNTNPTRKRGSCK